MSLNPSTRVLVAVKSCERDWHNGANEVICNTWKQDLKGVSFFIFTGKFLGCSDLYEDLPKKTRAILEWAQFYDFVFLCDTDTFLVPKRLLASEFEKYDMMGFIAGDLEGGKYYPWPSGGAGYWLSRRAMKTVLAAPLTSEWAEDRMVGQILGSYIERGELTAFNHPGYHRIFPEDKWKADVTMHGCFRERGLEYDPSWMQKMWEHNREP